MATLVKFCYVCKRHITLTGSTIKECEKQFNSCGHDSSKVARLMRGLVGKAPTSRVG